MELIRVFSAEGAKAKPNYLLTQKKYEIIRTVLFFSISLAIFLGGYLTTKTKVNLLSVVAAVGCLPACKSAVQMIMYLRFKGLDADKTKDITERQLSIVNGYDLVFTTYQKCYVVGHLCVCDNQICGYTEQSQFSESEFKQHVEKVLSAEGIKNVSIKIFTQYDKYLDRMNELQKKEEQEKNKQMDEKILEILKSVIL